MAEGGADLKVALLLQAWESSQPEFQTFIQDGLLENANHALLSVSTTVD